nr:PREDICTED: histone H3.v1-like [Bemisia tabaci]XP_018913015.1 PREDICTED: histone H3.v1-like [Bemisia tabaci]XP_018913016.1 PREDICTED: histone H3.v1-like [Bemisia tabaci]
MSFPIDAENLIEELEEDACETDEAQNYGVIEEISTVETLTFEDKAAPASESESNAKLETKIVDKPITPELNSTSEEAVAPSTEVEEQISNIPDHKEEEEQIPNPGANTSTDNEEKSECQEDTEKMVDTSETMSAPSSPPVPEIVPNSETHVSNVTRDDDCSIVSTSSTVQNQELEALHTVLIKEEEEEDDASHVVDSAMTFNVYPEFEENLDPKFKPTIRLEKIEMPSGTIKVATDAQESGDEDSTAPRPKRSLKTPSRLASGGFILDPKAPNAKTLQKTPAGKVVKNFIPIRPKPANPNDKGTTVTLIKSGQTPVAKKGVPSETAKEIVRKLNADSVPSILKRKLQKQSDEGDSTSSNTSSSTPAKKAKVVPPKKPTRKHRKVFDYESYLRDHLEAEVKDKRPKSNRSETLTRSSLVGINVAPSKIKVVPFNLQAKSTLLRKSNENDTNNVVRPGERTLYDLMQDVSRLLPSWNLHVLPDSNSFCIAQVCRGRSGIPTLKTSIELDEEFNAKVFIHQLHCKRYDGIYDSEESICALIQEIDTLSK